MNRIVDVLLNLTYRSVLSCRHFALHSLVCSAGLTILFWPMFFSGFTRLQDNPGDTLLNHYILEHTWTCVSRTNYTGDFWNPPFFYPVRNVLAYSETLIGVAPVYWFFRLIFAETHAYQAWIITMAGGTYICTVWALRRMEISHLAAATASFLFSFGMIRSNQVGHQQLLCQLFTAPAIAFLWSYLQQGKTINLLGLTACATMQILACIYLGWFTAFAMALFSIMVLIFDRNSRATVLDHLRNNPVVSSLIACAGITCLIPIIAMYLIANTTSPRPLSECILYAPRWSSWLAPPPGWIAWPAMSRFTHLQHCMETWLFFGFMPYILSLVSIISIVFSLKKARQLADSSSSALLDRSYFWQSSALCGKATQSGPSFIRLFPGPRPYASWLGFGLLRFLFCRRRSRWLRPLHSSSDCVYMVASGRRLGCFGHINGGTSARQPA